jgi:hypothetical protein
MAEDGPRRVIVDDLQRMALRWGMKNAGLFRGPAGVEVCYQTYKFYSRAPPLELLLAFLYVCLKLNLNTFSQNFIRTTTIDNV